MPLGCSPPCRESAGDCSRLRRPRVAVARSNEKTSGCLPVHARKTCTAYRQVNFGIPQLEVGGCHWPWRGLLICRSAGLHPALRFGNPRYSIAAILRCDADAAALSDAEAGRIARHPTPAASPRRCCRWFAAPSPRWSTRPARKNCHRTFVARSRRPRPAK